MRGQIQMEIHPRKNGATAYQEPSHKLHIHQYRH